MSSYARAVQIETGAVIAIHYTIEDEQGDLVDATPKGVPWVFVQGSKTCPPGLETVLHGRSAGDRFEVLLPPDQTYGERRADLVFKVPKDHLPKDQEPRQGQILAVVGPGGETELRVIDVEDEHIRVDGNHPLAGQTLRFSVEVASVRASSAGERLAGEPLPLGSEESALSPPGA